MCSLIYDKILEQFTDYRSKTTFWDDFSIADQFEDHCRGAIEDTYNTAMDNWKNNYVYLTELVMVLNHKIWQWAEINPNRARLYDSLWRKADGWAVEHLKDDQLNYFFRITD